MVTIVVQLALFTIVSIFAVCYVAVIGEFEWSVMSDVLDAMTGGVLEIKIFVTLFVTCCVIALLIHVVKKTFLG